jgi:hypothetical protein
MSVRETAIARKRREWSMVLSRRRRVRVWGLARGPGSRRWRDWVVMARSPSTQTVKKAKSSMEKVNRWLDARHT